MWKKNKTKPGRCGGAEMRKICYRTRDKRSLFFVLYRVYLSPQAWSAVFFVLRYSPLNSEHTIAHNITV